MAAEAGRKAPPPVFRLVSWEYGSGAWGESQLEVKTYNLKACSKSGILALQTPRFYLAGSKRARKSGFLRSIDRKNPQFEQALTLRPKFLNRDHSGLYRAVSIVIFNTK
jgi:hypothetical protein